MTKVKEITQESFQEFTKNGPCIIMCTASWCGPCKQIKPVYSDLVSAHAVRGGVVDVDAEPRIAEELRITSIPSFVTFGADGDYMHRLNGADQQGLRNLFKTLAASE